MAKTIYKQIVDLTSKLISSGLCDDQNFPSIQQLSDNVEVITINVVENAIFLKHLSYEEMYYLLCQKKAFNIKMIDGALLQMQYKFRRGNIEKHRLAFFPSPNLVPFQNNPGIYLKDEMFNDVSDKRIVAVPLRFDFDNGIDGFGNRISVPIVHPISHLTIGQYKNCRIPVSSALTPYQFVKFIIMNFYNTVLQTEAMTLFQDSNCFESTLYPEEKELIRICTPEY